MFFDLASISPISFELTKVGDLLKVVAKEPRKNEYRGSIGEASRMYLICKGTSKIGIIPPDLIGQFEATGNKRKFCKVVKIDLKEKTIRVEI
jgi:hypothetical protein